MTAGPLTVPFVVEGLDQWFRPRTLIKNATTVNFGDLMSIDTSSNQIVPASSAQAAVVKPWGVFLPSDNNSTDNYLTGDGSTVYGTFCRRAIIKGTATNPLDSTRIPGFAASLPVYLGNLPITTVSNYTCIPPTNGDYLEQVGWVHPSGLAMIIDVGFGQAGGTVPTIVKGSLAAVDTAGGVGAWQNQTGADVIASLVVSVTTVASGACSLDCGETATNATTLSDNMIDGLDVHTSIGTFTTVNQAGANGVPYQRVPAGKWITLSTASGASAGLVGSFYVSYYPA